MSGSAQTQTFQIEHLLQSYGEALAVRRAQELPVRNTRFDSRSMLAGFLAVFIFAPGCATATVFLMQTEKSLPSISHPPASKSNRMPLSQWKAQAPVGTIASAREAATSAEIGFLEPLEIRGRLEEQTLATAPTEVATPLAAVVAPSRPKRRHEAPRPRPVVNLVAEAALPEAAPPSFLEKLFALRTL